MSGGTIPYHLRQNKAVDRNLFIEVLSRAGRIVSIPNYVYIGFGGPFLEDFKAIHAALHIKDMISIEMDKKVLERQNFNKPLKCIECKEAKSDEFIKDYSFDKRTIIWLDYTSAAQLGAQLNDVNFLMSKLGDWDFLKVTLNANASALVDGRGLGGEELFKKRKAELKHRAGQYLPADIEDIKDFDILSNNGYPKVLSRMLENAIKSGTSGRRRSYFQPLTSFVYADGQKMLTLTGVILPDDDETKNEFFLKTKLKDWELSTTDWGLPKPISVPPLSIKERIRIEELLPDSTADQIQAALGFLIEEDEDASLSGIENFIQYYKQFPYYSRIAF